MGRRCPLDLEVLVPTDERFDAIADRAPPPIRAGIDPDRVPTHHRRPVRAAAYVAAMTTCLLSSHVAVRDIWSSADGSAAFEPNRPVPDTSPSVCQPAADRRQALDTLLQAALDAARDLQDDLSAHDAASASVALRYLRTYLGDAKSTEDCGIEVRPAGPHPRDV